MSKDANHQRMRASEPSVDWESARVEDGRLTVMLKGDLSRDWVRRFERTAVLLGRGEWDHVALKRNEVRVKGVEPGTEEKLRHFLESLTTEANAVLDDAEEDAPEEDQENEHQGPPARGEDNDSEEEMTQRFKSFADGSAHRDAHQASAHRDAHQAGHPPETC